MPSPHGRHPPAPLDIRLRYGRPYETEPLTRWQRVDLRRLRLHRHTQCERGQHSDDGNEPDGVRHAGLSAQDDVMSDPMLPLAGRGYNAWSGGRFNGDVQNHDIQA